ncbi:phage tail protein [Algoriphagus marinus]|uniref:phage tail protein n=1 Tax=Algoriphagus marinus TaxID=1925762 RepID=UPI000A999B21|nr:tail fiber protein [Algoriphagus marinus]
MEPFIGQIMMFGGNFAPRGWALCHGQLLPIPENEALFSLLGTIYGGDGRTTFGLPDLRGRCAVGMGQGPGLTSRQQGSKLGQEEVTLTVSQMPSHTHQLMANNTDGNTNDPANNTLAKESVIVERSAPAFPVNGYSSNAANVSMNASSVGSSGGNLAHNNMQPSLTMNYVIALVGIYPSRS